MRQRADVTGCEVLHEELGGRTAPRLFDHDEVLSPNLWDSVVVLRVRSTGREELSAARGEDVRPNSHARWSFYLPGALPHDGHAIAAGMTEEAMLPFLL